MDHSSHIEHVGALLDLLPPDEATHVAVNSGYWFNANTWADGRIPGAGAKVYIPENTNVTYAGRHDTELDVVRVDGTLKFASEFNSRMVLDTMLTGPHSSLIIGTRSDPVRDNVEVEIVIADNGPIDRSWDPEQLSRGVITSGHVEMHGEAKTVHLKVAADPMAGDQVLTLSRVPQNWEVGDKIVIAGTHHVDFAADGSRDSQDEVRHITAINGNRVTLDRALDHDHDAPASDLHTSVANYTRNIVISSENGENLDASERGHTMFMHNADVDVRYVEFDELGRTDKSKRLDDFKTEAHQRIGPNSTIDYARVDNNNDGEPDQGAMNNVRGRYSVHFHQAGNMEDDDPGYLEGIAVWGSPGWGIVNHDSAADIINNATFNTFGAGFVGETGNETGSMKGNIAIFSEGTSDQFEAFSDSRTAFHGTLNHDLGYAGFGYWFNGRLIELEDNVAAGSGEAGFGWMTRGVDGIDALASSLSNPLMARGHVDINHNDDAIITVFDGNEVISSWKGVLIDGQGPAKNHDGYNVMTDLTAWGIEKTGFEVSYSSKYILDGFRLISDQKGEASFGVGIRIEVASEEVMVKNTEIEDFRRGVVNVNHTTASKGDEFIDDRQINLINVDISGNWSAAIENTFKQASPAHVFDNVSGLPHYALNLIFDDASLRFTRDRAEILDMFPDFHKSIQEYKNQPGLAVKGTKYDSLGIIDYPVGNEIARFDQTGVNQILATDGYSTLKDGTKVVVLGEMITDRLTGETRDLYFVTELPEWWYFDGRQIDKGAYVHYTGVYRPGFVAASNIPTFSNQQYVDVLAGRTVHAMQSDDDDNGHHNHGGAQPGADDGDAGQNAGQQDQNAGTGGDGGMDHNTGHGAPEHSGGTQNDSGTDTGAPTGGGVPQTPVADHTQSGGQGHGGTQSGGGHTGGQTDTGQHTGGHDAGQSNTGGQNAAPTETPQETGGHDQSGGQDHGAGDGGNSGAQDQGNQPQNEHNDTGIGQQGGGGTPGVGHQDDSGDAGVGHQGNGGPNPGDGQHDSGMPVHTMGARGHSLTRRIDESRVTVDIRNNRIEIDTDGDGTADNMLAFAPTGPRMGLLLSQNNAGTNVNIARAPAEFGESKRLGESDINGIIDEAYLAGSSANEFRLDIMSNAGAKYANTLGVYQYSSAGTISAVQIVAANVKTASGPVTVTVDPGNTLGFFLIPDGANTLPEAVLSGGTLGIATAGGTAALTHNGRLVPGVTTFVSHNASLNADGKEHVLSGADPDNSGGMIVGFEDKLRSGASDDDFQDVLVMVSSQIIGTAAASVRDFAYYRSPEDLYVFIGEGAETENAFYSAFSALTEAADVNAAYLAATQTLALENVLKSAATAGVVAFETGDLPAALADWDGETLAVHSWAQNWEFLDNGVLDTSIQTMAATAYAAAWAELGAQNSVAAAPLAPAHEVEEVDAYIAANVLFAAMFDEIAPTPAEAAPDGLTVAEATAIHSAVAEAFDALA